MSDKVRRFLYWFLTGIFLSLAAASMIVTRDGNLGQFYDDGDVVDLKEKWINSAIWVGQYDATTGNCILEPISNDANWIQLWLGEEVYENTDYLTIEVDILKTAKADLMISYYGEDNELIKTDAIPIENGKTVIELDEVLSNTNLIGIYPNCQENLECKIHGLYLSEYKEVADIVSLCRTGAIIFCVYSVLSLLLLQLFRMKKRKKGQTLNFFAGLDKKLDEIIPLSNANDGEKEQSWFRVFLFCLLILNGVFVPNSIGWEVTIFNNLIIWFMLFLQMPRERESISKNPYLLGTMGMVLLVQFLSDVVVVKKYAYRNLGCIWMLLSFGVLYYMWGRMKKPEKLLDEFAKAVEILFWLNCLQVCFGDSWKGISGELAGIESNPQTFSMHLLVFVAVFLFRMYRSYRDKKPWYVIVVYTAELILCIWMIYKTDGRAALMTAISMIFIYVWFVCRRYMDKRGKYICTGLCGITIVGLFLARENPMIKSLLNRGADAFLSGRVGIWEAYLKDLNLLGNVEKLVFDGTVLSAHNEILMLMHKYGIFIGVFVIVFVVELLCQLRNKRKCKEKSEFVLFAELLSVTYVVPSVVERFLPFTMLNWWAFFICLGYIMQEKEQKNAERQIERY